MWCTQCHTAFSWQTGTIITKGQFHNPHFYEYQRQRGTLAPGAVDMDGCPMELPSIPRIDDVLRRYSSGTIEQQQQMQKFWYNLHREFLHVQDAYNRPYRTFKYTEAELRYLYLTKAIDEAEFKLLLQRLEKHNNVREDINELLDMYVATGRDLCRKLVTCDSTHDLHKCAKEGNNLRNYVVNVLRNIEKRYNISVADRCLLRSNLIKLPD